MSRHSGKSFPPGEKMPAAAEAYSILNDALQLVPREPHDNKSSLLGKAAAALNLSYWQAKKIKYHEISTVDADKLKGMEAALAKLEEDANANQARLNDLIYLRNDLRTGGGRSLAGSRNPGAAGGERTARDDGDSLQNDRPSAAAVRPTR